MKQHRPISLADLEAKALMKVYVKGKRKNPFRAGVIKPGRGFIAHFPPLKESRERNENADKA